MLNIKFNTTTVAVARFIILSLNLLFSVLGGDTSSVCKAGVHSTVNAPKNWIKNNHTSCAKKNYFHAADNEWQDKQQLQQKIRENTLPVIFLRIPIEIALQLTYISVYVYVCKTLLAVDMSCESNINDGPCNTNPTTYNIYLSAFVYLCSCMSNVLDYRLWFASNLVR